MTISLDMMQTTALAVVVYYFGVWAKKKINILNKFCIPAPVVGGLAFAIVHLVLRQMGIISFKFDGTLQKPFMMIFFTSIGLGASMKLIKKGSIQVLIFWIISLVLCIFQNVVGITLAKFTHQNPLIGLLAGSITMVGGHGTGGAFGPEFAKMGVKGATSIAMASATFGLIMGSIIGGPIGKNLIEKKHLKPNIMQYETQNTIQEEAQENVNYQELFRTFALLLIAIAFGAIIEKFFRKINFILPSYVNSMFVAAIILNVGESTNKWHVNQKCNEILGNIGLNVFLCLALITLRLWELASIAGPLLLILLAQTIFMALYSRFVTFNLLGKDYDAAVLTAGQCGFGMGATANGIANMDALKEKYGPAPRAYFVLPIVGAFLIDITNAGVITAFLNIM